MARSVVAHAQNPEAKQVSTAILAAAVASIVSLSAVDAAYADVAGLVPCSESKAFAKLEKKELKALQKRQAKVNPV